MICFLILGFWIIFKKIKNLVLTPKQKKKKKKMEATKLMPATLTDPLNRKLEGESSVKYKYVVYEYYVFF